MRKRFIASIICFLFVASGCFKSPTQPSPYIKSQLPHFPSPHAIIVTDRGNIELDFIIKDAPVTVANFINLSNKGFYNGLTFHRVVPDFVIQGGDPNGDGTGGPGYTIPDEFNSRPHLEGTVGMAHTLQPHSAGSQFYICLAPAPSLDFYYTVFAQVTDGMGVVKAIQPGDIIRRIDIVYK